jgi:siroheme synthase
VEGASAARFRDEFKEARIVIVGVIDDVFGLQSDKRVPAGSDDLADLRLDEVRLGCFVDRLVDGRELSFTSGGEVVRVLARGGARAGVVRGDEAEIVAVGFVFIVGAGFVVVREGTTTPFVFALLEWIKEV